MESLPILLVLFVCLSAVTLLSPAGQSAVPLTADLVLLNGKIHTVSDAQPQAEAVACRDGRIVAVGSTSEIRKLVGPATRVIDLQGRLVVPGFNDAHVHFFNGGVGLASVQLRDAKSEAEFRERIRAFAAKLPQGRWILEGNWDHENWTPARLPTRQLVDDVTPHNPVFIQRLDGHMALASSLALKLAGITRETADPPGGTIVRDEKGEPTGVLKDAAMSFVHRVIPNPSDEEIAEAVRAAMRYAAENGVTSVQDMSAAPNVLSVYQKLLANNELTVRIYAHQPLTSWERLAGVGVRAAFGGEKLKIGGLKGFADGSLGSTTALFFEPYLDAPDTAGLPSDEMFPESGMQERILKADRAGLQIAVHAIGDRANSTILRMYEEAIRQNGERDRRFRIEHAQHLRKAEIQQFAKLHVIASMQPYHAIDDGRWAEKRIGPERAKGTYAFRSLLDAGAILAFGSDWFVAPMEPLMGIYAAVTRRTLDGKHPQGWVPAERITVAEAIRAYTMGSAYASFEEKLKGSIEPGKLADLVVLSDDILTINPIEIEKVKVVMTIFDGRVIYERR
ncbi:MAG TPA: amidohydrolase [Blastocatellia bacterium]|nr:amidohydrolase [Blastocatellia bacterium]